MNDTKTEVADAAGVKEKTIYVLKSLIELIENDRVRLDEIRNLTSAEIIERAEAEAERAQRGAADLRNTPDQ